MSFFDDQGCCDRRHPPPVQRLQLRHGHRRHALRAKPQLARRRPGGARYPRCRCTPTYIEALSAGDTAMETANGLPVVNHGESLAPYVSGQREVGVKFDSSDGQAAWRSFSTDKPRGFVGDDRVFRASGKDRHRGESN